MKVALEIAEYEGQLFRASFEIGNRSLEASLHWPDRWWLRLFRPRFWWNPWGTFKKASLTVGAFDLTFSYPNREVFPFKGADR